MAGQGFLLKTVNLMNGWLLSANRVCFVAHQNSVRTIKEDTKDRLKSLKIPDKPKKPLTAYMQYMAESRNILLKENPSIRPVDIIKTVAQQWKTVTEDQKSKYQEKFKKEQEVYDKEILKYNTNLTEEQREALHAASTEKKQERKKRKLTKLLKETHKPKRPPGPYLLYLKELSQTKNIPQNILMKSVKDEWAKVPEAEKQRYKDEYTKELVKFEVDLKNWEKQMLVEGHPELVRVKSKVPVAKSQSSRILDLKHSKLKKE